MKKLKIFSIILAACMALGVFASCTAADKAAAGELEGTWVCESATIDGTDLSFLTAQAEFEKLSAAAELIETEDEAAAQKAVQDALDKITINGNVVSNDAYSLFFEEKGVCYFTRLDVLGGYDSPHYSWTYRNGKLNIAFGNYEVLGSKGTWEYKNKKVIYTEKDGKKTLVVTFAKSEEEKE